MKKIVVLVFLVTGTAAAQNNRSVVSASGLDTNPCTVVSPCRSFATALTRTNSGGEVVALDSAGYGTFSISQDVAVSGAPGIHAAVTATSGDAVPVNGGTFVEIANLVILGGGTGSYGIDDTGATLLRVTNCVIQGFATAGVFSNVTNGKIIVDHTAVEHSVTGMEFDNTLASVTDSNVLGCTTGISVVSNSTSSSDALVARTTFQFNDLYSLLASATSSGAAFAALDHCVTAGDTLGGSAGVRAYGVPGTAQITLNNNYLGKVSGTGTYTIYTTGNNYIVIELATLTPAALK